MEIKYTVHSVAEQPIEVTAQLNGQDIRATVPGFVVELISTDEVMGHTFRFVPADAAAARELFAPDSEITLTFTRA